MKKLYLLSALALNLIVGNAYAAAAGASRSTTSISEHAKEDLRTVFQSFPSYTALEPAFEPKVDTLETFRVTQPQLPLEPIRAEASILVGKPHFIRLSKDGRAVLFNENPDPEHVLKIVKPGIDGRVRIEKTRDWPYSVHGYIETSFANGLTYLGTGTLVGPNHVLTAGHNIYSHKAGEGWPTRVTFVPALDVKLTPFGKVEGMGLLSVEGWVSKHDSSYDIGMIILNHSIGNKTGWFGLLSGMDDDLNKLLKELAIKVNVTGYPSDLGKDPYKGKEMWTMGHTITHLDARHLYYQIDTYAGQSGSGVWAQHKDRHYTLAVHTYGDAAHSRNYATRLSDPMFDRIIEWLKGTGYTATTGDTGGAAGASAATAHVEKHPLEVTLPIEPTTTHRLESIAAQEKQFNHVLEQLKTDSIYKALIHEAQSKRIFISYFRGNDEHTAWVETLCENLLKAGFEENDIRLDRWHERSNVPGGVFDYNEEIMYSPIVLLIGSKALKETYEGRYASIKAGAASASNTLSPEITALLSRITTKGNEGVIPIYTGAIEIDALPVGLLGLHKRRISSETYFRDFFELLQDLLHPYYKSVGASNRTNPIKGIASKIA